MAEKDGQRCDIGFAVIFDIASIIRVKNGFSEKSDGNGVWEDICTHLVGYEQWSGLHGERSKGQKDGYIAYQI